MRANQGCSALLGFWARDYRPVWLWEKSAFYKKWQKNKLECPVNFMLLVVFLKSHSLDLICSVLFCFLIFPFCFDFFCFFFFYCAVFWFVLFVLLWFAFFYLLWFSLLCFDLFFFSLICFILLCFSCSFVTHSALAHSHTSINKYILTSQMNHLTVLTILSLLAQRLSIITQVTEDVDTGLERILISQTPSDTVQSTPFGMLREKRAVQLAAM